MGKKHKQRDNSLEKWKEWQEHQYDPGYWTGGNIPPYLNVNSKKKSFGRLYTSGAKVIGWVHILVSVALIAIISMILLSIAFGNTTVSGSGYSTLDMVMAILLFSLAGGLGVLGILFGMKYLDKSKSKRMNVLIISLLLLIGLIVLIWPSDKSEMVVKSASGETVIFRFQKDRFGSGTSCRIIDPVNKNEIARFSLPGQVGKSKYAGWSLEYLIDCPELKIYGVKGGIIFKAGSGKYQSVSYFSISEARPKDTPDLVPIAKALVAKKEWRWMKTFGAFLLEAGDQDVKEVLQRYAEGRFSEEELKKNRTAIPGIPWIGKDEIQSFAKGILGQ